MVPHPQLPTPRAYQGLAEQVAEQVLMCDTLLSGAQNAAQPKLIMQVYSVRKLRDTNWRSAEERGLRCRPETTIRSMHIAQPLTVVGCPGVPRWRFLGIACINSARSNIIRSCIRLLTAATYGMSLAELLGPFKC